MFLYILYIEFVGLYTNGVWDMFFWRVILRLVDWFIAFWIGYWNIVDNLYTYWPKIGRSPPVPLKKNSGPYHFSQMVHP
jgi:hypothetical protein